jgi:putative membrane protein insertion efficiency factor
MKTFFQAPIKGYQRLSRLLPGSCRYYPTCSEYAMWQFEFNRPDKALLASTLRILRCNQLFAGGIDYPLVHFQPQKSPILCNPNRFYGTIKIDYWLVPNKQNHYAIIKDLNDTYLALSTGYASTPT